MRKSTILIVVVMLGALAVLIGLGNWQMQRLAWKEQIIEMTRARSASAPLPLEKVSALWDKDGDVDYVPVNLSGTYKHAQEIYYFNTNKGVSGWNVFTPLQQSNGNIVIINRGFVPDQLKAPQSRPDGLIKGEVKITGLARNPILEKPNSLIPDNEPQKRQFYWKDYTAISKLAGAGDNVAIAPFFVDAGKSDAFEGYPLGGTTRMSFPNNHLQYALTWYGLALALLAVGGVFLYSRRKSAT